MLQRIVIWIAALVLLSGGAVLLLDRNPAFAALANSQLELMHERYTELRWKTVPGLRLDEEGYSALFAEALSQIPEDRLDRRNPLVFRRPVDVSRFEGEFETYLWEEFLGDADHIGRDYTKFYGPRFTSPLTLRLYLNNCRLRSRFGSSCDQVAELQCRQLPWGWSCEETTS